MSKINSINNKSGELTIDPGASGDSFLQLDINTTGKFRLGVDDTDSDSFKISSGSALGTTDCFIMTSAGERTLPIQPAFSANNYSPLFNVTGDGTNVTLSLDTELFDQASNFSTTTFTAPVTGRYLLTAMFKPTELTSSHTSGYCYIATSNRSYLGDNFNVAAIRYTLLDTMMLACNALADMDASDTATAHVVISNGTKVVDLDGGWGVAITNSLNGYLVC